MAWATTLPSECPASPGPSSLTLAFRSPKRGCPRTPVNSLGDRLTPFGVHVFLSQDE